MNKKTLMMLAGGIIIAGGVTAYFAMDKYMGNNIEIESALASAQTQSSAAANGAAAPSGTAQASSVINSQLVNGSWVLADASKVYWSVTTSKETVNFVNEAVEGKWNVNLDDAAAMSGEGIVDMSALSSGNGQRDGHVKDARFLAVETYPQATFKAESFSGLPKEWEEGKAVPFEMSGKLTVKGVEKAVTFASEAMYKGGQLLVSGKTTVTFADFGLTNPHTVLLDTQNELGVQLELVLTKE
ncbi:YceI family protein [Paenibacillus turpanensis]|uniref:YceI family protein n=1 Tax=Paenibacillus turpanensis TaxID=2689078 RepID=UPI00140D9FEB|nr:YceI family protein [Paenibacillus turpanensis]